MKTVGKTDRVVEIKGDNNGPGVGIGGFAPSSAECSISSDCSFRIGISAERRGGGNGLVILQQIVNSVLVGVIVRNIEFEREWKRLEDLAVGVLECAEMTGEHIAGRKGKF